MTTGSSHGIDGRPFQGRVWRDLAQFAAEALATGLLVSLVLALAIFIATTQPQSAEPALAPATAVGVAASGDAATPER